MSYAIAGGEQYNMVIAHPSNTVGPPGQPMSEVLARMRAYYEGWDPRSVLFYNYWPLSRQEP